MKKITLFILSMVVLSLSGCGEKKEELMISAASSLTEAIQEIEKLYEEKYSVDLTINIASSGTLQKQIEEGSPVDVFLSASKGKMDKLQDKDLLLNESRKNLLRNKLVLVKSSTSVYNFTSIEDLNQDGVKIAIGEPGSVPVGKYSKQTLEHYKLWEQTEDKLVYAKNVRQTLAYIESGDADVGIVYYSDTAVLKNSAVVFDISEASHEEIVYPVSIVKNSENAESAKKFIEFLSSNEAIEVFEKNRFVFYDK